MGFLNYIIEVFQTNFPLRSPSTSPVSRKTKKIHTKPSNEYKNQLLLKKSFIIRKKVIKNFFKRGKNGIHNTRNAKVKFQNYFMLDNNNEGVINKYGDKVNVERRTNKISSLKKTNEKFNVNFQENSNIKDNLMMKDVGGSERKGKLTTSNIGSFNPMTMKDKIASKSTDLDTENVKKLPISDVKNKVPKLGEKKLNLDVKQMGQSDFKNKMSKSKESVLKTTETENLSKISKSELNNKISSMEKGNSVVPGVKTSIHESLNTNETKNQVSAFEDLELQTQTSSFSFSGETTEEIQYKPHFFISTLPETTETTFKEKVSDKGKKSTEKKKKKEPISDSLSLNTLDIQNNEKDKLFPSSIKNIELQESSNESSISTSANETSKDTKSSESMHFLLTNSSPSSISTSSEILTKQSSNLYNSQESQKETKGELKKEAKQELTQEFKNETKLESKKETKESKKETKESKKETEKELKPESKKVAKQELKPESKKETKESKKEAKQELKPESKKETKESKIEAKQELKPESKKDAQQELKPESKKETKESKKEAKQELKPESKKDAQQELKPESKKETKESKKEAKQELKLESKKENKPKDKNQATNIKLGKPEKETKDKSKSNTKLDGDDSKKKSLKKELGSQNPINNDPNTIENVTSTKVKNLTLKKETENSKEPIADIGKSSIKDKKSKDKSIFSNKSVKSDKISKKKNDEKANLKSVTETSSSIEVTNDKDKLTNKNKDSKTSITTMDSKAKSLPVSNQTSPSKSVIAENSISKVSESIQTTALGGQSKTNNGESNIETATRNHKPDMDGKQCDELSDLFINNREDLRNISLGMHCRICESIFDCCCNCGCLMDENRIPVFSSLKCRSISKTKCCRPLKQNRQKSICKPKLSWECKRPFYSSNSSDSLTLSYNCIVGDEICDNYCPQRMICISR